MLDREELQLMINKLQVLRWQVKSYPERHNWADREDMIKRLTNEITELKAELDALLMRKAG